MSTLYHPHVARKATRPATVRPVPATFGVGILDDAIDTAIDRVLTPSERATVRLIEFESRPRDSRNERNSGGIQAAWKFGYRLGRAGHEEVNPSIVYNRHERAAFVAGYEEGIDLYHRNEIAMVELRLAEMEREGWGYGDDLDDFGYDQPWGDGAEFGSAMGHAG